MGIKYTLFQYLAFILTICLHCVLTGKIQDPIKYIIIENESINSFEKFFF